MDKEALISAMVAKGHTRSTAEGAIAGRGMADLWREYMGGSGGAGGMADPAEMAAKYAQAVVDAQKKQIDEEVNFLTGYSKDNPFVFDEALARQSATAEYEPYYTELLDDYLKGVDLKRQSITDEQKLLTDLYRLDTTDRSRQYGQAVAQAEEGFSGKGLFFSGFRAGGVGEKSADYAADQDRTGVNYKFMTGKLTNEGKQLDLDQSQKMRDTEREKQENIESGILTRQNEAITQYNVPLTQAYYRRFPSSSGSVLNGYTVPEVLRY